VEYDWKGFKTRLMGEFLGVQVLAAWWPAPRDRGWPWRWGVVLEGRLVDDPRPSPPYGWVQILASYNDARTEEEARTRAEEQARTLLESLPEGWVSTEG